MQITLSMYFNIERQTDQVIIFEYLIGTNSPKKFGTK